MCLVFNNRFSWKTTLVYDEMSWLCPLKHKHMDQYIRPFKVLKKHGEKMIIKIEQKWCDTKM